MTGASEHTARQSGLRCQFCQRPVAFERPLRTLNYLLSGRTSWQLRSHTVTEPICTDCEGVKESLWFIQTRLRLPHYRKLVEAWLRCVPVDGGYDEQKEGKPNAYGGPNYHSEALLARLCEEYPALVNRSAFMPDYVDEPFWWVKRCPW